MPKPATTPPEEDACCRRTRERWERRIRTFYASLPVIKDVPCDECRRIVEIRVYDDTDA